MKKTIIVSDETGKELADCIEVTIDRKGHAVKRGNTLSVCPARFHLAPDEIESFCKKIQFEKSGQGHKIPPMKLGSL